MPNLTGKCVGLSVVEFGKVSEETLRILEYRAPQGVEAFDEPRLDEGFVGVEVDVDLNWENITKSAEDPLGPEGSWWQDADDPWQCLATCMEINKATNSKDPAKYMCNLPVHQDGSCNGLQHYAALGRDFAGGRAVNLVP
ncbi:MAG: DNA-directed RNA polymerase, partial [Ilumatobacteraceae bacterium]